jgi:2-haloacid dehalogenase
MFRAGRVQAVLFDTFGTVVDWRSGIAAAVAEVAGAHSAAVDSAAFADAWRAKYQPSMEPIRTGRRPFVRLSDLLRENLAATLEEFGWNLAPDEAEQLNQAWQRLPAWPDSVDGLRLLKQHYLIGPLSNGDTALLVRMAKHAGLPWDVVLDLPPSAVMLVAAHNHDLTAARQAGLATGFIPRPTEYGPAQRGCAAAHRDRVPTGPYGEARGARRPRGYRPGPRQFSARRPNRRSSVHSPLIQVLATRHPSRRKPARSSSRAERRFRASHSADIRRRPWSANR